MKIECKICGCEFNPAIEKHYVSRDDDITGIVVIAKNEEVTLYDTFDCPQCGCQVVVQERKRNFNPCGCCNDCEENDE